tara:strand:+ start:112 stop:363 length:252 start_codon:yes stop_codon:yes gene_type:complete
MPISEDAVCDIEVLMSLWDDANVDSAPTVDISIKAGLCTQFADCMDANVTERRMILSPNSTHISLILFIMSLELYLGFAFSLT